MHHAKWQEYYDELQKKLALKQVAKSVVEYGEVIYQSPLVQDLRWLVVNFHGEYNVFVDTFAKSGAVDRKLGASFIWRDRAMDFALEMFLLCSGRLNRKNRYLINYE